MLFKEMAATMGDAQIALVDDLTVASNILQEVEVFESNQTLAHKYGVVTDVVGGEPRDLDAVPSTMSFDSDLESVDLQIIGGKIFVSEDKVLAVAGGSLEQFINRRFPKILAATGNSLEYSLVYNVWESAAIAAGNAEGTTKTSGDNCFSVLAIRFEDDECGLAINPNATQANRLMSLAPLYGGNRCENSAGVTGWMFEMRTMLAAVVANPAKQVAAIVNIDDTHLPTKKQMNDMIEKVYPDTGGRTVLIMSPFLRTALEAAYGESVTRTSSNTKDVGKMITMWYERKIVTSHKMLKAAEPFVTLP